LALVSSNPLRIKDVEISFDADITDVEEPQEDTKSPDVKS